jgi:hypothetical protein
MDVVVLEFRRLCAVTSRGAEKRITTHKLGDDDDQHYAFRPLAKLQCASIRVAILTDGITHLGSALRAVESHRKGAQ